MKLYRPVLVVSAVLLFLALALPLYTANRIPGSFIMWEPVLIWLLPVVVLILLLYLLPRLTPRTITVTSIAGIGAFAAWVLLGTVSLIELLLFSIGALAIILAARSRAQRPTAARPEP